MTTIANAAVAPYPAAEVAAAVARGLARANDRPDPALDITRTPQKYAALARGFRDSAWDHLEKEDLPQASNKAWGLVAETVKAISAQHGGIIHSHRAIVAVLVELARLAANAGDVAIHREINRALMTAGRLHINFYEDELHEDTVLEGLIQCEELSQLLYHRFAVAGVAPAAGVL